jgi:hypothetical protein
MNEKRIQKEIKVQQDRLQKVQSMTREEFIKHEIAQMKKSEEPIDQGIAAQAILQGRIIIDTAN